MAQKKPEYMYLKVAPPGVEVPQLLEEAHLGREVGDLDVAADVEDAEVGQVGHGGRDVPDLVVADIEHADHGEDDSLVGIGGRRCDWRFFRGSLGEVAPRRGQLRGRRTKGVDPVEAVV